MSWLREVWTGRVLRGPSWRCLWRAWVSSPSWNGSFRPEAGALDLGRWEGPVSRGHVCWGDPDPPWSPVPGGVSSLDGLCCKAPSLGRNVRGAGQVLAWAISFPCGLPWAGPGGGAACVCVCVGACVGLCVHACVCVRVCECECVRYSLAAASCLHQGPRGWGL